MSSVVSDSKEMQSITRKAQARVLLLTLQSTASFYENLNFNNITKTGTLNQSNNFATRVVSLLNLMKEEKQDNNLSDESKEIPLVLEVEQMIGNMIAPEEVIIMERILP